MPRATNRIVFNDALLPDGQARWGLFGAGFCLECMAVGAMVVIPLFMPQKFEAVPRYWVTEISAPHVEAWKPQPVRPVSVKRTVVKETPKPEEVMVQPKPKIYSPVITSPIAKPVVARKNTAAPDMTEVAKAFPEKNPVSMGSSAIPNIKKPREPVQTGGFGDPDGLKANNETNRNPNIEHVGAFELPNGPGYGNGTGGAKGARGVVASAGFGNGIATGDGGSGRHGTVQQGGFADEQAVAAPRVKRTAAVTSGTHQVEVTFKPKPAYTDEARAKKIEGDVLLQVVFAASGQVVVQKIVRGLGYGLDASAEEAAREIRFHPAEQDGRPVDFPAVVHITFQMAY